MMNCKMVLLLTLSSVAFQPLSAALTVRDRLKEMYTEFDTKMTNFGIEWAVDKTYPGKALELYVKRKKDTATGKGRVSFR